MASVQKSDNENYIDDPNFAVICSFFERFAKLCGITYPSFIELQGMLQFEEQAPQELVDLHIKLLRKARKSVSAERWERAFTKLLYSYSPSDSCELERIGYNKLDLSSRLRVLKILLDAQFDWNMKFKTDVNKMNAEELRQTPLGTDINGKVYWAQVDCISDIRIYQEDAEENTWTLVARDGTSLGDLIDRLTEEQDPDYKLSNMSPKKEEQEEEKEELNTNLHPPILSLNENQINSKTDDDLLANNSSDSRTVDNIKCDDVSVKLINNLTESINSQNGVADKIKVEDSLMNEPVPAFTNQRPDDCLKAKINLKFSQIKPALKANDEHLSLKEKQRDTGLLVNEKKLIPPIRLGENISVKTFKNFVEEVSRSESPTGNKPDGKKLENILLSNLSKKLNKTMESNVRNSSRDSELRESDEKSSSDAAKSENLQQPQSNDKLAATECEEKLKLQNHEDEKIKENDDAIISCSNGINGQPKLHRKRSLSASPVNNKRSKMDTDHHSSSNDDIDNNDRNSDGDDDGDDIIEEPLMLIKGVGSGKDCDTGNPGDDWSRNKPLSAEDDRLRSDHRPLSNCDAGTEPLQSDDGDETSSKTPLTTDNSFPKVSTNVSPDHLPVAAVTAVTAAAEKKKSSPPKLWTIDAICGNSKSDDRGRDDNDEESFSSSANRRSPSLFTAPYCLNLPAVSSSSSFIFGPLSESRNRLLQCNHSFNIASEESIDSSLQPCLQDEVVNDSTAVDKQKKTFFNDTGTTSSLKPPLPLDGNNRPNKNDTIVFRYWEDNPKTHLITTGAGSAVENNEQTINKQICNTQQPPDGNAKKISDALDCVKVDERKRDAHDLLTKCASQSDPIKSKMIAEKNNSNGTSSGEKQKDFEINDSDSNGKAESKTDEEGSCVAVATKCDRHEPYESTSNNTTTTLLSANKNALSGDPGKMLRDTSEVIPTVNSISSNSCGKKSCSANYRNDSDVDSLHRSSATLSQIEKPVVKDFSSDSGSINEPTDCSGSVGRSVSISASESNRDHLEQLPVTANFKENNSESSDVQQLECLDLSESKKVKNLFNRKHDVISQRDVTKGDCSTFLNKDDINSERNINLKEETKANIVQDVLLPAQIDSYDDSGSKLTTGSKESTNSKNSTALIDFFQPTGEGRNSGVESSSQLPANKVEFHSSSKFSPENNEAKITKSSTAPTGIARDIILDAQPNLELIKDNFAKECDVLHIDSGTTDIIDEKSEVSNDHIKNKNNSEKTIDRTARNKIVREIESGLDLVDKTVSCITSNVTNDIVDGLVSETSCHKVAVSDECNVNDAKKYLDSAGIETDNRITDEKHNMISDVKNLNSAHEITHRNSGDIVEKSIVIGTVNSSSNFGGDENSYSVNESCKSVADSDSTEVVGFIASEKSSFNEHSADSCPDIAAKNTEFGDRCISPSTETNGKTGSEDPKKDDTAKSITTLMDEKFSATERTLTAESSSSAITMIGEDYASKNRTAKTTTTVCRKNKNLEENNTSVEFDKSSSVKEKKRKLDELVNTLSAADAKDNVADTRRCGKARSKEKMVKPDNENMDKNLTVDRLNENNNSELATALKQNLSEDSITEKSNTVTNANSKTADANISDVMDRQHHDSTLNEAVNLIADEKQLNQNSLEQADAVTPSPSQRKVKSTRKSSVNAAKSTKKEVELKSKNDTQKKITTLKPKWKKNVDNNKTAAAVTDKSPKQRKHAGGNTAPAIAVPVPEDIVVKKKRKYVKQTSTLPSQQQQSALSAKGKSGKKNEKLPKNNGNSAKTDQIVKKFKVKIATGPLKKGSAAGSGKNKSNHNVGGKIIMSIIKDDGEVGGKKSVMQSGPIGKKRKQKSQAPGDKIKSQTKSVAKNSKKTKVLPVANFPMKSSKANFKVKNKKSNGTAGKKKTFEDDNNDTDGEADNDDADQPLPVMEDVPSKQITMKIKGKRGVKKNAMIKEKLSISSTNFQETNEEIKEGRIAEEKGSESEDDSNLADIKKSKNNKIGKKSSKDSPAASDNEKSDIDGDVNDDSKTFVEEKKTSSPRVTPKSRLLLGLDVDNVTLNYGNDSRSIRQSRRIAQIKIREQAEAKYMEPLSPAAKATDQKSKSSTPSKSTNIKSNKKSSKRKKEDESENEEYKSDGKSDSVKKKKKKKQFSLKAFNSKKNPWKSSSGSSSENEIEDEHYYEEDEEEEEELKFDAKSDHEFSPESDLEDDDYVPLKKARTARRGPIENQEPVDDGKPCKKCQKDDNPEWILLCDGCDSGWHASCLQPQLYFIPRGDWFCPPCQHNKLLEGLKQMLKTHSADKIKRENEQLRKKRLEYVGISLSNILASPQKSDKSDKPNKKVSKYDERSSSSEESSEYSDSEPEPIYRLRNRRQTNFSYRFHEFDDLINSAIQGEVEAKLTGSNVYNQSLSISGNLKSTVGSTVGVIPMPPVNKVESFAKNDLTEVNETMELDSNQPKETDVHKVEGSIHSSDSSVSEEEKKSTKSDAASESEDSDNYTDEKKEVSSLPILIGRNIRKKPKKLTQLDLSTDEDHYSDEDFKGPSEAEEDDEEYVAGDTDSDEFVYRRSKREKLQPTRRSARARTTRFDSDFINDDSDDSEVYTKKKKSNRYNNDSTDDSEKEDSTWGKRKRNRYSATFKSKQRRRRKISFDGDSDDENVIKKASKKRKRISVAYGLSNSDDDEAPVRKTRGRKINYQENLDSDSELDTYSKNKTKKLSDDDEYIQEEEEEPYQENDAIDGVESEDEISASIHDSSEEDVEKKSDEPTADNSKLKAASSSKKEPVDEKNEGASTFENASIKTYSKATPEINVRQQTTILNANEICSINNKRQNATAAKVVADSARKVSSSSNEAPPTAATMSKVVLNKNNVVPSSESNGDVIENKSKMFANNKQIDKNDSSQTFPSKMNPVISKSTTDNNGGRPSSEYIPSNGVSRITTTKTTASSAVANNETVAPVSIKSEPLSHHDENVAKTADAEEKVDKVVPRPIRVVSPSKLMDNPEKSMLNSPLMMSHAPQRHILPPGAMVINTSIQGNRVMINRPMQPIRTTTVQNVVSSNVFPMIPRSSNTIPIMGNLAGIQSMIEQQQQQQQHPQNQKTAIRAGKVAPSKKSFAGHPHGHQQQQQRSDEEPPEMIPLHMLKPIPSMQPINMRTTVVPLSTNTTTAVTYTRSPNMPQVRGPPSTGTGISSKRVKITPTRARFNSTQALQQTANSVPVDCSIGRAKISERMHNSAGNTRIKTEPVDSDPPTTFTLPVRTEKSSAVTITSNNNSNNNNNNNSNSNNSKINSNSDSGGSNISLTTTLIKEHRPRLTVSPIEKPHKNEQFSPINLQLQPSSSSPSVHSFVIKREENASAEKPHSSSAIPNNTIADSCTSTAGLPSKTPLPPSSLSAPQHQNHLKAQLTKSSKVPSAPLELNIKTEPSIRSESPPILNAANITGKMQTPDNSDPVVNTPTSKLVVKQELSSCPSLLPATSIVKSSSSPSKSSVSIQPTNKPSVSIVVSTGKPLNVATMPKNPALSSNVTHNLSAKPYTTTSASPAKSVANLPPYNQPIIKPPTSHVVPSSSSSPNIVRVKTSPIQSKAPFHPISTSHPTIIKSANIVHQQSSNSQPVKSHPISPSNTSHLPISLAALSRPSYCPVPAQQHGSSAFSAARSFSQASSVSSSKSQSYTTARVAPLNTSPAKSSGPPPASSEYPTQVLSLPLTSTHQIPPHATTAADFHYHASVAVTSSAINSNSGNSSGSSSSNSSSATSFGMQRDKAPYPPDSHEDNDIDDESTGEFGGLVSYFSSQRENDLDE